MPIAFKCKCGKGYKVPDEAAGKKLKCKECGQPLQVPAAKSVKSAKKAVPADSDPFSMDFGLDDDPMPTELPPRRRKESGQPKPRKSTSKKKAGKPKTGLFIGIGVAAVAVIGAGVFLAMNGLPEFGGPPEPLQVTYANHRHEDGGFTIKYPEGWEVASRGGTGGRPPFATFEDGTARFEVKHNEFGATASTMATIPSGGPVIPGDDFEEAPPEQKVHEANQARFEANYTNYEELPGEEFQTPYGNGWLSVLTAKDGFTPIKAYRLTFAGGRFQYTIFAKCPESRWEKYEGVFKEMMKSFSN